MKDKIQYCKKCVMPSSAAIPVEFDDNGVCSGCNVSNQKVDIDWDRRKKQLQRLLDQYKSKKRSLAPCHSVRDSLFKNVSLNACFNISLY